VPRLAGTSPTVSAHFPVVRRYFLLGKVLLVVTVGLRQVLVCLSQTEVVVVAVQVVQVV